MGGSLCGRELRAREKRGDGVGKTKRGKGSKWVVVVDGAGLPLGGRVVSANPAEVTLLEETLETIRVPRPGRGRPRKKPKRVIADKAYDSDLLRMRLWKRRIELIVPPRKGRLCWRYDGRKQRRYRKRWKICLAAILPASGGAVWPLSPDVCGVFSFGLCHIGAEEVMKPVLVKSRKDSSPIKI